MNINPFESALVQLGKAHSTLRRWADRSGQAGGVLKSQIINPNDQKKLAAMFIVLQKPEREIHVNIPVTMDDGSLKIFLSGNSFIWFRASKTESGVLRVISDAPDKTQSEAIIGEALNLINNS